MFERRLSSASRTLRGRARRQSLLRLGHLGICAVDETKAANVFDFGGGVDGGV